MESVEQMKERLDREQDAWERSTIGMSLEGESFTVAELREYFEQVQPPTHWKDEIRAVVYVTGQRDLKGIKAAVVFYAGCVAHAELTDTDSAGRRGYKIRAVGYRAAVGC